MATCKVFVPKKDGKCTYLAVKAGYCSFHLPTGLRGWAGNEALKDVLVKACYTSRLMDHIFESYCEVKKYNIDDPVFLKNLHRVQAEDTILQEGYTMCTLASENVMSIATQATLAGIDPEVVRRTYRGILEPND